MRIFLFSLNLKTRRACTKLRHSLACKTSPRDCFWNHEPMWAIRDASPNKCVSFWFNKSQIEGVREQGAEENISTSEGWSDRRLEKISNELGGTCITHEGDEKCVQNFGRKVWREDTHSEDLGVDGKIILRRISRKHGGRGLGSFDSG
jgi:hypothetical protein